MKPNGFAIIEALIGICISMITIYATATMMANVNHSMRGLTLSMAMLDFMSSVTMVTQNQDTCTKALLNQPFGEMAYTDASGTQIQAGVQWSQLSFTSVTLNDLGVVAGSPAQHLASLRFAVAKTGETLGAQNMVRAVQLRVVMAGANVQNCFSGSGTSLASMCTSIKGVFDPVAQVCTGFSP